MAIATRAIKIGRGTAPILIQAQSLRDRQGYAPEGPQSGFPIILGDEVQHPVECGNAQWLEQDVARAIAAAEQAGVQFYRVDIAPDGTISIIVGAPAESGLPGQ